MKRKYYPLVILPTSLFFLPSSFFLLLNSWFLSLVSCLFLLPSCHSPQTTQETLPLTHPLANKYATYFKIYKEDTFTLLITYLNESKSDSAMYVLYKNEKPSLPVNGYYIKLPLHSVACLSTLFVGAMNNLGCLNYISAIDNADYICNPLVRNKCSRNEVLQLAKNGVLNIEQTLACKPELVFANPNGDPAKDFDARLIKAGITPVICADYFENTPLARAEWCKALALFFNAEQKADSLFSVIEKEYVSLKAIADNCKHRPTVFFEKKTGDAWFMPGGKSYQAQLVQDAGADYIFKNSDKTGSLSLNEEQVITQAKDAGYWLNLHHCTSLADLLKEDKRYEIFSAFKTGNVYNNNNFVNENGGNAYWEYGLNRPDELLAELICIFHPGISPDRKLTYYKQLH